jgi:lipopolysaccharide transport system permease protein
MSENCVFVMAGEISQRSVPTIVVEPSRRLADFNLRELWDYRDLLLFLAWRDISIRYKQTVLGAAWAVIQPVLTMLIFTIFFGNMAGVPSEGVPYPLFSFAALLPWQYFSTTLINAANSLVNNSNLLSKVYFPRLLIPLTSLLPPAVDFVIAFMVMLVMMISYRVAPTWNVLWLPVFMLLAVVTTLGAGLWFAALNVKYRDVRYIVPVLVQFGLFVSPVAYPSSVVPGRWRPLYALNPMAGVIEGFRWALLGTNTAPGPLIAVSSVAAIIILVTGLFYFRRTEKTFADVI